MWHMWQAIGITPSKLFEITSNICVLINLKTLLHEADISTVAHILMTCATYVTPRVFQTSRINISIQNMYILSTFVVA